MDPIAEMRLLMTRRALLGKGAAGIGTAALGSLLAGRASGEQSDLGKPHFKATAKRVIYLFMADAPSQLDMWDYKPAMAARFDQELPDSIRRGQRITTMTSGQKRFPVAPSVFEFAPVGQQGTWISELLPFTAKIVDRIALLYSLHTEAINHDPGITFMTTGAEQPGRPSLGAWLSYGLGSDNRDLPAFVVLHSTHSSKREAQALFSRLWGSGFIPSLHQGVALRGRGDPVLFLQNPPGVTATTRRRMLDAVVRLNHEVARQVGDPETLTRIAQAEMAFRMQTSVPELLDLTGEPEHVLRMYGPDVQQRGTFAYNALLARRLIERDVRFVQVFHRGWDQHFNLPTDIRAQCRDIDQPCAALIRDLEQRGLLDDTLVVWASEFGRTIYCQGELTKTNYGRDHHPRCFTVWLAGGGIKAGARWGKTDDFSYNVVENPVHVHDLNATILHCLGLDHQRLTYRFQGRDYRLTDVHGHVVRAVLSAG